MSAPVRVEAIRGAALVVTLILLVILTLLASTGLRMSVGELWMAGNEQYHRRAIDAASAGIEVGVARVGAIGPAAATDADGDRLVVQDGAPETFTVVIRPAGYESTLSGSSVGKLVGEHFEIESTGGSLREARDVQVQGVMVVSASGGEARFTRIAGGLEGEEP